VLGIGASRGLVAAALLSTAVVAAFVMAPLPERVVPERDPFVLFPRSIGSWSGNVSELEPEIERVLGADDYITATYEAPGETSYVNLFVAYYDTLTEGEGLHSPEVCLPVGGWEVFSIDPYRVDLPGTAYGSFDLNRAVIQKGLSKQIVYYWFEQRGKRMTNDYLVKASVVYDSLTLGRTDGALVRFVTALAPGESEADADARMQRFMAEALQDMPRFVPE
jgi:EpsI family protein